MSQGQRQKLLQRSMEIMQAKNHDYSGASGDPLDNFRLSTKLGVAPLQGIGLRILDKHQRIRTFISKGMLAVKNESVADAILDCVNYVILANAYVRNVWVQAELFHTRAELEAEANIAIAGIQYPSDPRILLDNLEGELCTSGRTVCDFTYLLNGYLSLGEVLINE